MSKKLLVFLAGVTLLLLALVTYSGPASAGVTDNADPGIVAQDGGDCTACHNDTSIITGKAQAWEESMHGMGTSYVRGASSSCAGCHSGGGFCAGVLYGDGVGNELARLRC